jgi:alkanesulfonate monooxygenase SsuD/methylene tetrahydromethanopterin reductase-like flavin-dependent oxidoreductase (luciferase family)
MADFGLAGAPESWPLAEWPSRMRDVLDSLPPAFTTVWLSDHLQLDGEGLAEGWTRLTYLAALCPRYRFGHLVLSQSYRNPALLGAMAATLQNLTGGRFILGLGAGWLEEEYRAYHWEYPRPGIRVAQLAETIQLVKALWTGSAAGRLATWQGEHYAIEDAITVAPVAPIPVMVGTNGPKALAVTARHADWWTWDGPWDVSYRRPYEDLRASCAEIGRPFEELTLTAELSIALPDDPTGFDATRTHSFYPGQVFGTVGPTAGEVIREIETLVDVGVSHFQLSFDSVAELDRFVDEVVPHVHLERKS